MQHDDGITVTMTINMKSILTRIATIIITIDQTTIMTIIMTFTMSLIRTDIVVKLRTWMQPQCSGAVTSMQSQEEKAHESCPNRIARWSGLCKFSQHFFWGCEPQKGFSTRFLTKTYMIKPSSNLKITCSMLHQASICVSVFGLQLHPTGYPLLV